MQIIKSKEEIMNRFDFFESYVNKIAWSEDLFDLIITVNYFWQDENNCKDCDVKIILKNCTFVSFDSPQNSINCNNFERTLADSYVMYSIQTFEVEKDKDKLIVQIGTTELNHKWLKVQCSDLWVEY